MDTNTFIISGVTLAVGLFAFIIYRFEKIDKDKSASNIVLEEIRTIESNIEKLKESGDFFSILPANLSTSGWFSYRHTLVKHLDFDEISKMGLFFERTEALKDVLNQWRNLYFSTMQEKSLVTQRSLAGFVVENKNYKGKKKKFLDVFEKEEYWFEPDLYKKQIKARLGLYTSISTTTTGDKLKKISKSKWYKLGI